MRPSFLSVVIVVLIVACSAGTTTTSSHSATSTASTPASSVAFDSTSARTETTDTSETAATVPTTPPDHAPSYEVFLAAVAEATVDTRFADVPFDEPEITVATGLALCEAITDGDDPEDVIIEFLADLTGGQPTDADDDQLVLTGALIGAAESALCPDDL